MRASIPERSGATTATNPRKSSSLASATRSDRAVSSPVAHLRSIGNSCCCSAVTVDASKRSPSISSPVPAGGSSGGSACTRRRRSPSRSQSTSRPRGSKIKVVSLRATRSCSFEPRPTVATNPECPGSESQAVGEKRWCSKIVIPAATPHGREAPTIGSGRPAAKTIPLATATSIMNRRPFVLHVIR